MKGDDPRFEIEPRNKFAEAACSIVEYELRPGHTVAFMSEVDLSEVEHLRHAATFRPSYTSFVVKAVGMAMREFPYANGRICRLPWLPFWNRRIQKFNHCDVAVASEREEPQAAMISSVDVIRDADRLSLETISRWLRAQAGGDETANEQWRLFKRMITRLPHWLSAWLIRLPVFYPRLWAKYRGAAAWVSSPAKYGVDIVAGTWPSPLGVSFGLVKERPVVLDGLVVARPTFMLTLNWDRRVMAGAPAARFFKRIVDLLEHAATEMAPRVGADEAPAIVERQS